MRTIVGYPNIPLGYLAYVPGISFCCEDYVRFSTSGVRRPKKTLKKEKYVNIFLGVFDTSAGEHTAFILHLMNAIGDAFNGAVGDNHLKRILWTKDSYHDEFFRLARGQLRSMRFANRGKLVRL